MKINAKFRISAERGLKVSPDRPKVNRGQAFKSNGTLLKIQRCRKSCRAYPVRETFERFCLLEVTLLDGREACEVTSVES